MKCVSLYTGCGGLDLGFHAAGFTTIWANDVDRFALETYAAEVKRNGRPVPEIYCGDIAKAKLPSVGAADVVIGGPPCQGFSVAGRMDPNDPRSRQVWEFFRVVEHLKPQAFVMENVKALAVNERWAGTMRALQEKGEELGYQTRLMILNAADFGVAQLRERMFLVGIKGSTMPLPKKCRTRKTVRKALKSLPAYGEKGNNSVCKAVVTVAKAPVLRKSPFAGMLFNGQGRPLDLDSPSLTLPASMGGNRTPIVDQLSLDENAPPWVVGYHALLSAGGKVATHVPDRLRRLTVEEAACLQGFPQGMTFYGSQCAKFRQIGNSVPPALGEAVGRKLLATLQGETPCEEWNEPQGKWLLEDPAEYKIA